MITAAIDVICFGKAAGRQVLLDRKMRKLYNWGDPGVGFDNDKQTGRRRQNGFDRIFQAPVRMEFRNRSCLEVK